MPFTRGADARHGTSRAPAGGLRTGRATAPARRRRPGRGGCGGRCGAPMADS